MKASQATLCLIEDDPIMGESLVQRFGFEGINCEWFALGREALAALQARRFAAIVSDIRLPDLSGEDLFRALNAGNSVPPPTIFITGYGTIDQAVRLMNLGARDYLTKPFDLDELLDKLQRISPELFVTGEPESHEPVLGISGAMRTIETTLRRVADSDATVLISGESGVGKEHVAQFLHACNRPGEDRPFVAINCAALPEHLMEAELFGYERGAFTGAVKSHRGVFERSDGGTLFLDEIGEMPPAMQSKLLRAVQDHSVVRLGSETPVRFSSRLVCATNRDLKRMVGEGLFREDLYYRINVVHLQVPPLRERREDIPWFARRFLAQATSENRAAKRLLAEGESYLKSQDWPGNLRELRHAIERAVVLSRGETLGPAELRQEGVSSQPEAPAEDLKVRMEHYERQLIEETLRNHGGRVGETAEALGISRKNLWEKVKKYGVEIGEDHRE